MISQSLSYKYGGSAVSEASLAAELQKENKVTVLVRLGGVEPEFVQDHGVRGVKEYTPRHFLRAYLWGGVLAEEVKNSKIVHLNGHWKWENYFIALLCKKYSVPLVLHPRGMLLVGHRKVFIKKVFNFLIGNTIVKTAARIILLSHFEKKQVEPYKIPEGKLVVLPNGFETKFEIKGIPFEHENPYFLYFGRLEQRKNLIFLIDTYKKYSEKGGKIPLHLIGPAERGYEIELRKKIEELELGSKVIILAPVFGENKNQILKRAKAVFYPTIEEPFGRVPFEVLLAGSAPIIPDASGSSEYLSAIIPFCVYQAHNQDSLLSRFFFFEQTLADDSNRKLKEARQWVEKNMNWFEIAKKVLSLYEGVQIDVSHASTYQKNNLPKLSKNL
jgi:glycosyltransferase involved in cell wall biosynthesis